MGAIHILDQADDNKTINVVYHYAVPSQVNSAGVNFQAALVQYLQAQSPAGTITSKVATAGELTQMQSGQLFEYQTSVRWSKLGLDDAHKLAELQANYNAQAAAIWATVQVRLQYWGGSYAAS